MITSNLNYMSSDGRFYSTQIQLNQSSDFVEEADILFPEYIHKEITDEDIVEECDSNESSIIEEEEDPMDSYDYIKERYNIQTNY